MRTRANTTASSIVAGLAAAVLLSAAAPAGAGAAPEPRAVALHWKTFVQFNGAKLQGCVERPAGSNNRIMHFRHDTRQANGPTKVRVLENINGTIVIVWRDAMTAPGHIVSSGRIGFIGEQHRFHGTIFTKSGARQTGTLKIAYFPTC